MEISELGGKMDMTPYAEAMQEAATCLLVENGRWDVDGGDVAAHMSNDARFADLDEWQFAEVRDAITDLVQTIADSLTEKPE